MSKQGARCDISHNQAGMAASLPALQGCNDAAPIKPQFLLPLLWHIL